MSIRYVVFGAGAVGGVVGARLAQAGHEVALVARGAHLEAIRTRGLRLITPVEETTVEVAAAADPSELAVGAEGDVVLMCVKSQDTAGALDQLLAAGADDVPVLCLQNGVANEGAALRRFRNVYGAMVIAPTGHLEPGVVEAQGSGLSGVFEIGRYPSGQDALARTVADAFNGAHCRMRVVEDVMASKYGKLLSNLANIVGALFAPSARRDELEAQVRAEGEATLVAAQIVWKDIDPADRDAIAVAPIAGGARGGSSTWQSLARATGAVETDFLNGEISLLGRLHGAATPLNDALCRLADRHVRAGRGPGELQADEALAEIR